MGVREYARAIYEFAVNHRPGLPECHNFDVLADAPEDIGLLKVCRPEFVWRDRTHGIGCSVTLRFDPESRKATVLYGGGEVDMSGSAAFLAYARDATEFGAKLEAFARNVARHCLK